MIADLLLLLLCFCRVWVSRIVGAPARTMEALAACWASSPSLSPLWPPPALPAPPSAPLPSLPAAYPRARATPCSTTRYCWASAGAASWRWVGEHGWGGGGGGGQVGGLVPV